MNPLYLLNLHTRNLPIRVSISFLIPIIYRHRHRTFLVFINDTLIKHERSQFIIAWLKYGNILVELRPANAMVKHGLVAQTLEMKNIICRPLEILSVDARGPVLAVFPSVAGVEKWRQDVRYDGDESADYQDEAEAKYAEGCV